MNLTTDVTSTPTAHLEVNQGKRFAFGKNWQKFLGSLTPERIAVAEKSVADSLGLADLTGKRLLDIGSGSGLFSLAARRLGAEVTSFDFDPDSVAATTSLRAKYFPEDPAWRVFQGSVLDQELIQSLGQFDIVYSWGVLHHTGDQWTAIANAASRVKPGGLFLISLYNDQMGISRRWTWVKALYNRSGKALRLLILVLSFIRIWGRISLADLLHGRPFHSWRTYTSGAFRGMHPITDLIDWVGGYPFEVSKPEEVFNFLKPKGFVLEHLFTCGGGGGCNEFTFRLAP